MNIIDCKKISLNLKEEYKSKLKDMPKLKLVVFEIGNDPASTIYVNNKKKVCEELGIDFELKKYESIDEESLVNEINVCNNDESVTGILVQLPLPDYLDEKRIIETIDYKKDIDGLTTTNYGNLVLGGNSLIPCTALGIIKILENENINLESSNIVLIGRSKLVGLPLISLFLKKNATVTVCHSKTKNLKEITKTADILVVAIGKKEYIDSSYIKDGATLIDVGINREDDKLYGDLNFDSFKNMNGNITKVPGGIGVMTVAMIVNNLIEAYNLQNNLK